MSPRSLCKPPKTSDMMRRRRPDGGAVDGSGAEQMMAAGAEQMAAAGAEQMAAAGAVQAAAAGDRQMAAAGAEGDAAQALGARGDAAERGLELVGQELVPASQALALRTPDGLEKGRGSDAAKGSRSPRAATEPVSQGQKSKEGSVRGQKGTPKEIEPEKRQEMATPSGQPVSLGPHSFVTPEGQVQSMLPLFSPEQTVKLHEIHQMPFASPAASWNGPAVGEHGHGGAERQAVPGWFTGLLQSVGSQQGEHEARQRDYMWRMQVEHGIEHLGVQLRAAQHENQRLRQERQELLEALEKKGSSRFTTPDDKAANMLKKEEGAESRQERPSKEEGAGARQGTPSKEEGAEARQDRSSQEDGAEARQEQSESDSSSEEPQRASRPKESVDKQSMRIMLKLMEGMQELQKQIVISKEEGKGDEIEVVRYVADLPKLAEWNPETAPIDFGDWVICLHPHMADLSSTSEMWWDLTLSTARTWYDHHMKLSPIERLTSTPRPTPELQQKKWSRLERRASSLLLNALPQTMKEEVIAAKSITALGILSRAMLQFQPGGLTERSAILTALEAPMEAATVGSAIQQLRRWMRWKRRALEVGVSIPDRSILMKGLGRLVRKIVSSYPDLNFRLSLVKSSLLVETVPTLETVTQYSEHLLAELEQMGQQAKRKEVMAESQPKVKKFEEASGSKPEERTRPKGKPQEEFEGRRKPCRFYLTDSGCRRGRGCPFGHQLDGERRCWTCGGKDHMATACPTTEESKPKAAKFGSKTPEKDVKSATTSPEKSEEQSEATGNGGEETMKSLLDEASRMLKSMNEGDVKEKRQKGEDAQERILGLQKQLDELKKASMRPFRISKLCPMVNKGLLDSGATHPLRAKRKGERLHHLPKVKVTLAGDKEIYMALTPTGVIVGEEGTEPIVPMGLLTAVLGCEISWKPEGLQVVHPVLGKLEVVVEAGCPMVSQSTAMKLIEEIEAKAVKVVKSLKTGEDSEEAWLRRLVDEHPALQGIPEEVKRSLVEKPATDILPLGNRRRRKLWRAKGMMIHAFSGKNEGYTLGRAFHEIGGDRRLMYEFDITHGKPEADLSPKGEAYPLLLRAALDGLVKGWIAGPPCRTRSVLRHLEVPGEAMPRPLRSWNGGEFGIEGLSNFEKEQVTLDDTLLMRFLVLYIVSETVRRAAGLETPTTLILEQPASPEHKPEVVSLWRTPQWKSLAEIYELQTQRFDQSEFGAIATKPTTIGGNLPLQVPLQGKKGQPRDVSGMTKAEICESSRRLSRWPPLMMRSIAVALQTCTMGEEVKLRAVSWQEHIAAGHTPFRRDCRVCQEACARDAHHRRQKLPPKAGVLSVDISGPFKEAPDLQKKKAKYLLVASFTWTARNQDGEEEVEEIPEVPPDAPEIEDPEAEEELQQIADQVENPEEGPKEDTSEELEERKPVRIEVTKLCEPLASRSQEDVSRAIINMYMRLRADGYRVTQLHSDRGAEFRSRILEKWCLSRTILQTFTPGDQPQMNGRCEAIVQHIKAAIRRTLHGAEAPFDRWPIAARFINEKLRQKQVDKEKKTPPFLAQVLVRKRFWRSRELEPTQEKVTYLCPSWVHHGHWIERADGTQALTKMVMQGLSEPPKLEDWIGVEDALNPIEERRRIRHKASIYMLEVEDAAEADELENQEGDGRSPSFEEEEKDAWAKKQRVQRLIEEEMVEAMEDDEKVAGMVLDSITMVKELIGPEKGEEVLQTRIVSQAEVRRSIEVWRPSIEKELTSLFETKGALRKITEAEVKKLLDEDRAELIPSKLVFTVKPDQTNKGGKKKTRLVACGNFSEREEGQDLFAGGASAVALRAALTVASQFGFEGSVMDVRTAFLNAPMVLSGSKDENGEKMEPRRAIIRPPALLILAGLAKPDEFYEVIMALYGYKESPKLWSDYRDQEIAKMELPCEGGILTLQQMITEPNMWRMMLKQPGPNLQTNEEEFVGLLLVYVDDLLVLGFPSSIAAVIQGVQAKWETSEPETINMQKEVRFLGAELWRREDGAWLMTQTNYIKDLLKRNLGADPTTWPTRKIPLVKEPEVIEGEEKTPMAVKEAQRVIGELVWITARSRPDLAFTVSKLASLITKSPMQVVQLVKPVWYYLAATMDQGLIFQNNMGEKQLNVYTDASYSDISFGCHLILWGSSLLLWKAGKQPIQAASTAEAELVEVLEGALAGDAVKVVLEEALDVCARSFSYTDSSAALAIIAGDTGSWRTRHLRKRAFILRSRVLSGEWMLRHLPGAEMPADLGTKVLSVQKFNQHKETMGMFLEGWKVLEKIEDGEQNETTFGMTQEAREKALKIIILVTKLALAGASNEEKKEISNALVIQDLNPVLQQRDGQFYFIMFVAVILFAGFIIGACVMGIFMWHRVDKLTVVKYKGSLLNVPAFLWHAPERDEDERNQQQRDPTVRPNWLPSTAAGAAGASPTAAGRAAGAAGAGSAAAGAAGASSTAAGRAAGAAGASSTAAGRAAGAAGASSSAAGRAAGAAGTSSTAAGCAADAAGDGNTAAGRAAGAASTAAGSADGAPRSYGAAGIPSAAAGAADGGAAAREPANMLRSRGSRSQRGPKPLFTTPFGGRYHCDRECHGLRHAKEVCLTPRCHRCGPQSDVPQHRLYAISHGYALHVDYEHCRDAGSNGPLRAFNPCAICCTADDRLVMTCLEGLS